MSTLFPDIPAAPPNPLGPLLFELPELPPYAHLSREPAGPNAYSLDALNDLLKRKGITLAQAMDHAECRQLLRVRQGVLDGTWPLSVYREEHACDCDHCTCEELQVYWHCPRCGNELVGDEDASDGWTARCDREFSADHPQRTGCGARFVARELNRSWHPFLVPTEPVT